MTEVRVEVRVDLLADGEVQELDEAAIAARLADGNTAALRDARSLDGALRIGDAEIADELFSVVQRLCFEGAAALLADAALVYRYFSSNEHARLAADGDTVVLSGSDVSESTFLRRELSCALYTCGVRWLAVLDRIGRVGGQPPPAVRGCRTVRARRHRPGVAALPRAVLAGGPPATGRRSERRPTSRERQGRFVCSISRARMSSGSGPERSTASWNALRSNRAPSRALSCWRSFLISSSPILYASAWPGHAM